MMIMNNELVMLPYLPLQPTYRVFLSLLNDGILNV